MRITHKIEDKEQESAELHPLQVGAGYEFDGGLDTHCYIDAPTVDFNVMARRDSVTATASMYASEIKDVREVSLSGNQANLVYCIVGSVVVESEKGEAVVLEEGEMLFVEGSTGRVKIVVQKEREGGSSYFIVVNISDPQK